MIMTDAFLGSGVDRVKGVLFSQPYVKRSAWVFYDRAACAESQRDASCRTRAAL